MAKRSLFLCSFLLILGFFTVSCSGVIKDPIIIWTNKSEIVAYVELFNLTNDKVQAVVVYKENPAESFPPTKQEDIPDILIGPWLKNSDTQRNFLPLDYLFYDQLINKTQFYPSLLQYGNIGSQQYLLPVNFNLSTMVFSQEYSALIPENFMLSAEQIQEAGASFNKTEEDVFTAMGYAPSWNPEFLYEVAKLDNANFTEKNRTLDEFMWNEEVLDNTITYFQQWTTETNSSTTHETEYQFKYLYNPTLKNILDGNSLFAFIPSEELFVMPEEHLEGVYFRWIQKNNKIVVNDDMLSMGFYKDSKNLAAAEQFAIWFMNEENQRTILNWYDSMNLHTTTFGVAGGFSSIRSVNERFYPILYPILWGNLPSSESLTVPNRLPANWDAIKESIILPYLMDATNTDTEEQIKTIHERLSDWYRFTQ